MDINYAYNLLNFLAAKDRKGLIDKDQFNLIAEAALYEFNNKRYGNIKDLLVRVPNTKQSKSPTIAYSINQKVFDDLKIFQVTTQLQIDSAGQAAYPTDYWHLTSMTTTAFTNPEECGEAGTISYRDTDLVDNDKVTKRLSSAIVPPTIEHPICTFYSTYIQFYPKTLAQARMDYLRKPLVPLWNSTQVNGVDVYSSSGSIDFEVPFDCRNEIIALMCQMAGINLDAQNVYAFGQLKEKEGF